MKTMQKLVQQEKLAPLFDFPNQNDIIEGIIIGQKRLALFVDLSPFGTGIVYGKEFFKAKKMLKNLEPGTNVKTKVLNSDEDGGYIELSITRAREEEAWGKLKKQMKEGETLFVMVTKVNKGGLIANVEGIPGFLPVSQLKPEHYPKVEKGDPEKILQELQNFIGKELEVAILSLNPEENNLILSEKEANTEKMQEILQQYNEGDIVQGKITGVVDFGAFLKFPYSEKEEEGGAIEGLIHISELDWQLIENPHDVISEGDIVKAQIIEISQGRVSLSLKALKKDPWNNIEEKYQKGNIVLH